jgi:micrococcal nuclease
MKRIFSSLLWVLLVLPPLFAFAQSGERLSATLVKVTDGDTLQVRIGSKKERVRLIGIDTPEKRINEKAQRDSSRTKQDLKTIVQQGQAATQHVQGLLKPNQDLSLEFDVERRDRHGRLLAYVYTPDGRMLNERIIANGFASPMTIPPNVRYAARLRAAFDSARTHQRGLWAK